MIRVSELKQPEINIVFHEKKRKRRWSQGTPSEGEMQRNAGKEKKRLAGGRMRQRLIKVKLKWWTGDNKRWQS